MPRHPNQPVIRDSQGILRYQTNAIVKFLVDAGPFDINALALMSFSDEDFAQLAQLIGYSVNVWRDLFYVSQEMCESVLQERDKERP